MSASSAATKTSEAISDESSYPFSCSGCYSSLLVSVRNRRSGRPWDIAEERCQVELAGWSYLNGTYAICPACAPAWASDVAA